MTCKDATQITIYNCRNCRNAPPDSKGIETSSSCGSSTRMMRAVATPRPTQRAQKYGPRLPACTAGSVMSRPTSTASSGWCRTESESRAVSRGNCLIWPLPSSGCLMAGTRVREAALSDGDAGPEVERFEAAAARNISELAAALADGSFKPSPVVRVEIAKPSGGCGGWPCLTLLTGSSSGHCSLSLMPSSTRCFFHGLSRTGTGSAFVTRWRVSRHLG